MKVVSRVDFKINAPSDVPNHKQRYLSPTVCHRIFEHLQDQQAYEFPALIKSMLYVIAMKARKARKIYVALSLL